MNWTYSKKDYDILMSAFKDVNKQPTEPKQEIPTEPKEEIPTKPKKEPIYPTYNNKKTDKSREKYLNQLNKLLLEKN